MSDRKCGVCDWPEIVSYPPDGIEVCTECGATEQAVDKEKSDE